ncbi:hypothetical protein B0H14DRAFT_2640461 [Mycena olivaceomarginata]|nr:hypothetical protein B0H14DRAFT_2640461 [Mycena olivaceomarginata]
MFLQPPRNLTRKMGGSARQVHVVTWRQDGPPLRSGNWIDGKPNVIPNKAEYRIQRNNTARKEEKAILYRGSLKTISPKPHIRSFDPQLQIVIRKLRGWPGDARRWPGTSGSKGKLDTLGGLKIHPESVQFLWWEAPKQRRNRDLESWRNTEKGSVGLMDEDGALFMCEDFRGTASQQVQIKLRYRENQLRVPAEYATKCGGGICCAGVGPALRQEDVQGTGIVGRTNRARWQSLLRGEPRKLDGDGANWVS